MFRPATTPSPSGTRDSANRSSRCTLQPPLLPRSASLIPEPVMTTTTKACAPLLLALLSACAPSGPGYRVYISNEGSGDLTIIDPGKMEAVATVPIGKRARGIHASADGKLIYIALSGSPFAPPGVDESTLPPPDKSADGIGVFEIATNK